MAAFRNVCMHVCMCVCVCVCVCACVCVYVHVIQPPWVLVRAYLCQNTLSSLAEVKQHLLSRKESEVNNERKLLGREGGREGRREGEREREGRDKGRN